MKSNIEVISDLLSEQIGCTQKERMEQYSKLLESYRQTPKRK